MPTLYTEIQLNSQELAEIMVKYWDEDEIIRFVEDIHGAIEDPEFDKHFLKHFTDRYDLIRNKVKRTLNEPKNSTNSR